MFAHCKADPFDEDAKRQFEVLLRAHRPDDPDLRYLELDRQLAEALGEPARFSALLRSLDEFVRYKLKFEHEHTIVNTISRLYILWLDVYAPKMALAVLHALRLRCRVAVESPPTQLPLAITRSGAVEVYRLRQDMVSFICRYERRPDREDEFSDLELQLTIRLAHREELQNKFS